MLTMQQTFDKVCDHLIAQNDRSLAPSAPELWDSHIMGAGGCAYRGERGLKCAVGVLIADEYYTKDLEGLDVYADQVQQALEKSGVPHDNDSLALLDKLQRLHDEVNPLDWPHRLCRLGEKFDLNVEKPRGHIS